MDNWDFRGMHTGGIALAQYRRNTTFKNSNIRKDNRGKWFWALDGGEGTASGKVAGNRQGVRE